MSLNPIQVILVKPSSSGELVTLQVNVGLPGAAGSGGGGSVDVHGSFSSPISIIPASGIVPTNNRIQIWWVTPSTSGFHPVLSSPQIAAGFQIGDVLKLKGVSATDALTFDTPNGEVILTDTQTAQWTWDGSKWSIDFIAQ